METAWRCPPGRSPDDHHRATTRVAKSSRPVRRESRHVRDHRCPRPEREPPGRRQLGGRRPAGLPRRGPRDAAAAARAWRRSGSSSASPSPSSACRTWPAGRWAGWSTPAARSWPPSACWPAAPPPSSSSPAWRHQPSARPCTARPWRRTGGGPARRGGWSRPTSGRPVVRGRHPVLRRLAAHGGRLTCTTWVAALVLWVGWLTVIGIGVTAGATLPPELRLESIGPLYIVTLVVMAARTAAAKVACRRRSGHRGRRVAAAPAPRAGRRDGSRPARRVDDAEEVLMSTWTIVLLAGLATFALRLVPVALLSTRRAARVAGPDRPADGAGGLRGAGRLYGGRRRERRSWGAASLVAAVAVAGAGRAPHPLDDLGRGRRDGHGLGRCRPRRRSPAEAGQVEPPPPAAMDPRLPVDHAVSVIPKVA